MGNAGISEEDEYHIKNANCVVRFNNFATRNGIKKTKDPFACDVLFSTLDLHSQGSNPKHLVIGIPAPFKIEEIARKPSRLYPNAQPWMINPYENMKLCKELDLNSQGYAHPLPSLGFTALWHMHKWPCNFYICGMNWYWDAKTGFFQGYNIKNEIYPSHHNHFYCKEVRWIVDNLLEKSNINFSTQCSKILNFAKGQIECHI